MLNTIHNVFYITSYYLAWFAGMLLVAHNQASFAVWVIVAISFIQILWQIKVKKKTRGLFEIVIMLTLLGTLVDSLFLHWHIIDFKGNPFMPYCSPPWMMAIWLNFSIVFYSVLGSFFKRYLLLGTLSLIAFPLAYLGGVKLGAAYFPAGNLACLYFGLVWAVLFPVCMYFYNLRE